MGRDFVAVLEGALIVHRFQSGTIGADKLAAASKEVSPDEEVGSGFHSCRLPHRLLLNFLQSVSDHESESRQRIRASAANTTVQGRHRDYL